MTRTTAAAPQRVKKAEDAVEVDTSELTLEESVERICLLIERVIGGEWSE